MILTEFPPSFGGMQTHAIVISRFFREQGKEIIVYTYRPNTESFKCIEIDQNLAFPVKRILSRLSYQYNLKVLRSEIVKFQPDLIYSSTIYYGILKQLTGIPTICRSVGNDITRPWIAYPFKIGADFIASEFFEKYLFKKVHNVKVPDFIETIFNKKKNKITICSAMNTSRILANSVYTKQCIVQKNISDKLIEIIVGGVDVAHFSKPDSVNKRDLQSILEFPQDKTILYTACRLVEKKKIDFLIKTFSELLQFSDKFHLVIVGDGHKKKSLIKLATDLNIINNITFAGAVSYNEIPKYYWAADIFILPSAICINRYTGQADAETMGRVLCEANAAGVPVIASESGGIPSIIHHRQNGLLFQECSEKHLIDCVFEITQNKVLADNLIQNGLVFANEKFDWKNVLNVHEKVFTDVLN